MNQTLPEWLEEQKKVCEGLNSFKIPYKGTSADCEAAIRTAAAAYGIFIKASEVQYPRALAIIEAILNSMEGPLDRGRIYRIANKILNPAGPGKKE